MNKQNKNFWSGEKVGTPSPQKPTGGNADSLIVDEHEKINLLWIVGGVLLALLITLAIVLNFNNFTSTEDATTVTSTINIDNGDTKINWERYPSYTEELADTYTITASGTYYLSGKIEDGMIEINTPENAVVRLVLDGISIKNSTGPAIACYDGDDLVIELVGENYLEDGAAYDSKFDEDVSGAIYSKADLTFAGDGSLELKANFADGIVGKDDVKISSGKYLITALDDGIRGKDSVYIKDGELTVSVKGDGIKSTNETESTKGFVLIENGKLTISAGDDGIHAETKLIVDGGEINITKSYEGLEAPVISINAGEISIYANDDGINAGGGADTSAATTTRSGMFDANENCKIIISGGNIYVNAAGDGIDSNGYIYFNGGKVVVDGPTNNGNGALDAGISITMNGGEVIAVGASGMAETLGNSSSIHNISVYFSTTLAAGTKIEIKNSAGETILAHTASKTFNHLAAGTDKFVANESYAIYVNGTKYTDFTISETTTVVGNTANTTQNPGGQRGQMR